MGDRRDTYAAGWEDGYLAGWQACVELLLDHAALEPALAHRLKLQHAAERLHANVPQIVRAPR